MLLGLTVVAFTGQALAQGDTWQIEDPMPIPVVAQATGVIGGKLFVPSYDFSSHLAILEVYDAESSTWDTGKAPPPTPRTGAAAGVIDGKLYVAGGCVGGTCASLTSVLEVYDPDNDTWTSLTPMPNARGALAAAVIDGKLYVVGGFYPAWTPVDWLDVYDPITDTWATLAPMPTPREAMRAVAIDGKLYVVGGYVRPGPSLPGNSIGTLEVYDPEDNTWTTNLTPMPTDRLEHAVGVIDGQLYAVGGDSSSLAGNADTLEVYVPSTDTWVTRAPIPTARAFLGAGVIDGKLYVAGGDSVGTLEVYIPPITTLDIISAKIEFNTDSTINDSFKVKGEFILSAISNGIDPLNEDVELIVGTSALTIPAGSFIEEKLGKFEFEGTINDAFVEMVIKEITWDAFKLKVIAEGVDLTNTSNPVDIGVTIGDDTGTANIRLKGKLKSKDDD